MYSGEYDACDVTLSVYPHRVVRASLKNMPGHGGNRIYDLWNTSPKIEFLFCLRRFDSHRGQVYFSSLPDVDIHSQASRSLHDNNNKLHDHNIVTT